MKINGYEIALSEEKLDDILEHKTRNIELIDTSYKGYQELTEGNKKALAHLIVAAKYFEDIALEQDHALNLQQKKGLEEAAKKHDLDTAVGSYSPKGALVTDRIR